MAENKETQNPEYIDLSDMMNSELPEENPTESNMPIGYDENITMETSKGEAPEPPQEEDLSHLVNPDGSIKPEASDEQMQKLGVDNPKSYRYFQSERDRLRDQYQKDLGNIQNQFTQKIDDFQKEIASLRGQSTPEKEKPLIPPERPTSDDPIDQVNYLAKMVEYQNKIIEKQGETIQNVNQTFAQQQEQTAQERATAQQRAFITSKFVQAGANPQRANEIITRLGELQNDPDAYAKFIVQAANQILFTPAKTTAGITQKGQVALASVPSATETPKVDEGDQFFAGLQDTIKKFY